MTELVDVGQHKWLEGWVGMTDFGAKKALLAKVSSAFKIISSLFDIAPHSQASPTLSHKDKFYKLRQNVLHHLGRTLNLFCLGYCSSCEIAPPARTSARNGVILLHNLQYLSSLIYTASALHAAVNFPQQPLTSFVPNTPAAVYQPIPTDKVRT